MQHRPWIAVAGLTLVLVASESCDQQRRSFIDLPDAGEADDAGGASDAGVVDAGAPDGGDETPDGGSVVRTWPPDRPGYVNPIIAENQQQGSSNWSKFIAKSRNGEIDGYADRVSAKAGDTVNVMISASVNANAMWILYRLGWYDGAGARQVASGTMSVGPQAPCPPDPTSGLVRCTWQPTFSVTAQSDWVSGLYVFKLIRDDSYASLVPLVITDSRPSDLLLQASVLTYQAYNEWGGASLYTDGPLSLPWNKALEVSFDRPYREDNGAGQMLRYDSQIARFFERYGYDVSYTTNLDVAVQGKSLLLNHGAFLSVGHDEYWSKSIRDAVQAARDDGVSLIFLSANSAYWQARLADDTGKGPRRVICWKESWPNDPDQGPEITSRFRDWPINRPENGLLGVMFTNWAHLRFPFVPLDVNHWLYEGTGLHEGDSIPWLMGYETDSRVANGFEPPGVEVLSRNTVFGVEGAVAQAETTAYRTKTGALVFSSGTIEWGNGLGAIGATDTRVARMTANVIREAIGVPIPSSIQVQAPTVRIDGPFAQRVTTVASGLGQVTSVAVLPDGALAVADPQNHRILRIGPPPNRTVSVLAGTGTAGRSGWGRSTPGAQVQFTRPTVVLTDVDGRVLVADTQNHCIRAIANDADHTVTTIAGRCGEAGFQDGDGNSARFTNPMGLTIDPKTKEIIVADSWNHRIRAIDHVTETVRTIAGSELGSRGGPGATALFYYPTDVTADAAGHIYVTSAGMFTLSKIDADPARTVFIIVTGEKNANDGRGDKAGLSVHLGLAWVNGTLIASDPSVNRIRRVAPDPRPDHTVLSTLAGRGRYGLVDGAGDGASFAMPFGLAVGPDGTIYVADTGNGAVRAIQQ